MFSFKRMNTNSPKFSSCLKLPYTKSGVGLFTNKFLAYPTRAGRPSKPCIGPYGI